MLAFIARSQAFLNYYLLLGVSNNKLVVAVWNEPNLPGCYYVNNRVSGQMKAFIFHLARWAGDKKLEVEPPTEEL